MKKKKKSSQPSMAKYSWLIAAVLIVLYGIYLLLGGADKAGPKTAESPDFSVIFIDVGQADAALLRCEGETMLIDGGNAADSSTIYTVLEKNGVTHLDYVICTHAHEDHVGGLAGALQNCTADKIYCPVTDYDSKAFRNFVKYAEKQCREITVPRPGEEFAFGGAVVDILACDPTASETNNSSIVAKITYGEISFLFTGDAEEEVERMLLEQNADLSATVLKVGHHGSSSSTSDWFLNEVMPRYAVISVGKDNSYGHPDEKVLSRLRDADVTVFRTDEAGDVICTSDGKTVTFQ